MDRQADVDSAGLDAIWLVQGCKAAASGAPRGVEAAGGGGDHRRCGARLAQELGFSVSGSDILRFSGQSASGVRVTRIDHPGEYPGRYY